MLLEWRCDSLTPKEIGHLLRTYEKMDSISDEKPAALVIAWYSKSLSDTELIKRSRALLEDEPEFVVVNPACHKNVATLRVKRHT